MSKLVCTGLRGSHPLGAMAAFGLLRVMSRSDLPQPVRLSWEAGTDWHACLHFPTAISRDMVLEFLVEAVKDRDKQPILPGEIDLKILPDDFAALAQTAVRERDDKASGFLAAFASELVLLGSRPEVKPTGFYMLSGQQRFLTIARDLTSLLTSITAEAMAETLLGPWRYQNSAHSLGWDPGAERLHALQAQSPTKSKAQSVAGAVWLGIESLPFFPVVARNRRLVTAGFDEARTERFSWPVWTQPITLETLRSLLTLADLHRELPDSEKLHRRGISHVFRSRRVPVGDKGYMIFRPADLVC